MHSAEIEKSLSHTLARQVEQESTGRLPKSVSTLSTDLQSQHAKTSLRLPDSSDRAWSKEEEELLVALKNQGCDWKIIVRCLPKRTEGTCRARLKKMKDLLNAEPQNKGSSKSGLDLMNDNDAEAADSQPARFNQVWTRREDELLITLRKQGCDWPEIGKRVERRPENCESRWYQSFCPQLSGMEKSEIAQALSRKSSGAANSQTARICRRWSSSEENLLITLKEQGHYFEEIAKHLPNRTIKSCRAHWYELAVRVDRESSPLDECNAGESVDMANTNSQIACKSLPRWSSDEEDILYTLRDQGCTFEEIADRIPNRTVRNCVQHWYAKFHAQWKEAQKEDTNKSLLRTPAGRVERGSSSETPSEAVNEHGAMTDPVAETREIWTRSGRTYPKRTNRTASKTPG